MGAILREQNALPTQLSFTYNLAAKDAIDNGGAGRAAKGANPSLCAKKRTGLCPSFLRKEGEHGSLFYRGFARGAKNEKDKNMKKLVSDEALA